MMRRAMALAGCGVLAMATSACESTERESAKIERESRAAQATEAAKEHTAKRSSHSHAHSSQYRGTSG